MAKKLSSVQQGSLFWDMRNKKSFDFSPWGGIDGFLKASSGVGGIGNARQLKTIVPWLAHGVDMTANAVASLPFDIVDESGKVIDSSDDWQDEIGGIPNPKRLLYLIASSLCGGSAYLMPLTLGGVLADVQYCAPHTVTPQIDMNGLKYFDRTTDQGKADKVPVDEMVYFWLPDSDVEIGPALVHPLGNALLASGLLASMDGTLKTYGDRGFVPATLLAAKGMPATGEREKAEAWWNNFLRGWTDVVAKIINSDAMSVQRVGAGLEELKGVYVEISRQQIEAIGTAFGIPGGLFQSDASFASEFNALVKQWYETSKFKSIYLTVEETLTDQLLLPNFGYRWQFKPETLDAFQEDNGTQIGNFKILVDALSGVEKKNSIAAQISGMNLPAGIKPEDLDPKEKPPQPIPPQLIGAQPALLPAPDSEDEAPEIDEEQEADEEVKALTLSAAEIKDLALWRQMATRFFRKGKGTAVDFECKALPDTMAEPIREKLAVALTELDIVKAFDVGLVAREKAAPVAVVAPDVLAIRELAQAINGAVEQNAQ
jgi:hypothetical protein